MQRLFPGSNTGNGAYDGGIFMWGFLSALISGALMSIQGVFNTNVTKQTSLWVSTGWVQFFCISGLCGSMVFHRQRKYRHAVAGGG